MSETTIDLLIGEARARQRKRRSVLAVVFAIVVAVALTAGLDRGRFGLGGGSGGSSGSASAVWRPTEDPSPYLVRNPSGAEQDFYALRPVPVGARLLRYVDAAGWSIVYPRRFHAVACSQFGGPIVGGSFDLQGASFANYRPVPALARRPPARGVPFRLTITITSGNSLAEPSSLSELILRSRSPTRSEAAARKARRSRGRSPSRRTAASIKPRSGPGSSLAAPTCAPSQGSSHRFVLRHSNRDDDSGRSSTSRASRFHRPGLSPGPGICWPPGPHRLAAQVAALSRP